MKLKMTKEEMNGVAEIELVYRNKVKASDRPKIIDSKSAYDILLKYWNKDSIELVEEFKIMLLNRRSSLLGIIDLSKGGTSGVTVDPKLLFAAALKRAAHSIIVAHNHPSGETSPSKADEELTRKLKHGATLLDIGFLDHLIITPDTYFSFACEGLL
jgi:DNA repair protein RadC